MYTSTIIITAVIVTALAAAELSFKTLMFLSLPFLLLGIFLSVLFYLFEQIVKRDPVPEPVKPLAKKWNEDKVRRNMYMHIPIGTVGLILSISVFRVPLLLIMTSVMIGLGAVRYIEYLSDNYHDDLSILKNLTEKNDDDK